MIHHRTFKLGTAGQLCNPCVTEWTAPLPGNGHLQQDSQYSQTLVLLGLIEAVHEFI